MVSYSARMLGMGDGADTEWRANTLYMARHHCLCPHHHHPTHSIASRARSHLAKCPVSWSSTQTPDGAWFWGIGHLLTIGFRLTTPLTYSTRSDRGSSSARRPCSRK